MRDLAIRRLREAFKDLVNGNDTAETIELLLGGISVLAKSHNIASDWPQNFIVLTLIKSDADLPALINVLNEYDAKDLKKWLEKKSAAAK